MKPLHSVVAIEETRGDQWRRKIYFKNPDGSAVNLTGFTISWTVKWREGSLDWTEESRDNAAGWVVMTVDESANDPVPSGQVSQVILRAVDANGETQTYVVNPFKVNVL